MRDLPDLTIVSNARFSYCRRVGATTRAVPPRWRLMHAHTSAFRCLEACRRLVDLLA